MQTSSRNFLANNKVKGIIQLLGVPIVLGVVVIISYGLLIREVGFYWDDWPFVLVINRVGPSGFLKMLGIHRPLLAKLYGLTTLLFGDHPLRWQLFGLITRWLAAVSVWWACRTFWPKHHRQVAAIALLFAVYPGFIEQHIAVVYSHYFLVYTVFAISLGAMVMAVRKRNWIWWVVSILASAYCMFSIQYFVGLEIARPLMIWYMLSESEAARKKKMLEGLVALGPYLLLMIFLFVWRLFLLPESNYEASLPNSLLEYPLETIGSTANLIINDAIESSLVAWQRTIKLLNLVDINSEIQREFSLIVIIAGIIAFGLLVLSRKINDSEESRVGKFPSQAIFLGLVMIFGAGWPFWIVPFEIELRFPLDRFILPMMFATSVLIVGLIELLMKSTPKRMFVIAMLVGFAGGHHFNIANTYKLEWKDQERFLWQLSWRIPSIKPGTSILVDNLPFPYSDDQAMSAVINFMYGSDADGGNLPFGFFELSESINDEIPSLAKDEPIKEIYGPITFEGSTSQAIVIYYSSESCLRVLNPEDHDLGQVFPGSLSEAVVLSNLENILQEESASAQILPKWFGPLENKGWCYYYEKAELARQFKDWDEIIRLGDDAFGLGIEQFSPLELFPFIEGYAVAGNLQFAQELTDKVIIGSRTYRPQLCHIWNKVALQIEGNLERQDFADQVLEEFNCEK